MSGATLKDTETIFVNGHHFGATTNLVMFFKQLCELYQGHLGLHALPLWVDAICINQSDIKERIQDMNLARLTFTNL